MRKNIIVNIIFLCVAVVIILVIVFVSNKPVSVETPTGSSTISSTTTSPSSSVTPKSTSVVTSPSAPAFFTLTQVAQHKTKDDCWTIVRGNVYNVTSWVSKHPGGAEAIISMCGIDASSAFVDQHDGKRKPEAELAGFKIGILQ